MGAYPQMVQDFKSLKEEAVELSKKTVKHIRADKKPEFRRTVREITNFKEATLYARANQGMSVANALSGYIFNVINLGRTAGTPGFSNVTSGWRHLLERCEAVGRKMKLFDFPDEQEIKQHLWWMGERGGAAELEVLLKLKDILPFPSRELPVLIDLAVGRINERLYSQVRELSKFFDLPEQEIIGTKPDDPALGYHLSPQVARKVEILDTLKRTMEEQLKGYDVIHCKRNIQPVLRGHVPLPSSVALTRRGGDVLTKQVKHLLNEFFRAGEASLDTSFDKGAETGDSVIDEPSVEAYAVARIKDYDPGEPFYVGEEYLLQAGVLNELPQGFEGQGISIPSDEQEVEFELVVHAEEMEIMPNWRRRFVFKPNEKSPLAEFKLKPLTRGDKVIRVEFLYQWHWLTTIRFEVTVEEK
ncbi:MAG TPA: hypothetical protein VF708_13280 [Pyrinomonadaceae bacterium]|jgi:hypothetical protein